MGFAADPGPKGKITMTILLISHSWDISYISWNWKGTRLLKTNLSMISAVKIKGGGGNKRLRPNHMNLLLTNYFIF